MTGTTLFKLPQMIVNDLGKREVGYLFKNCNSDLLSKIKSFWPGIWYISGTKFIYNNLSKAFLKANIAKG